MAAGRPSTYTPEKAEAIVERIAAGEFVEDICQTPGMPAVRTVNDWMMAHDEFRQQCARAREASAGMFERRAVKVAEDVLAGTLEPKAATAAANILTWVAKVRNRRVYGDKVDVDATVTVDLAAILSERKTRAA